MKKVVTLCGHEEMEGDLERNLEQAKQDARMTSVELKHFVWNDAKARAVDGFFQCNDICCSLDELMVQSCTGLGPPVWTSMHFLKRLTLSMVNISLPFLFPPSLEELSLFEVSLSEDVAAALGESLAQPTQCCLKKLDLTDSRFLANGVNLLAQGLAQNKTLSCLSVSECNLMDEQVSDLVRALEYHTSIRELDISFNKCRHFGVNALTRLFLCNVCRLSKLSLDFQAFGECKSINLGPILSAISSSPWPPPSSIPRDRSFFMDLGLGGNSLRDLQMPSLVDALCANHTLEKLDLSENRFTDVGIELFAKRLYEMKGLKRLVLEDNRFGISGIKALAVAMESNLILEDLEVTPKLMRGPWWSKIVWYMDLNWGGRRLLRQEATLPGGMWPLVLERASRGAEEGMSRTPSAADIIYCLVRGPALLER
jgi:hypothetical protein